MSSFDSTLRISLPMWALAVLGAATIHVVCIALAHEYLRDEELEADLGAPAIEIGIELLARREPTNLPPGPDVEEPSPPALEQVATEPAVLPREVPIETDHPELAVTLVETKEPKEDESVLAPAPINPAAPAIAARETARPSSEIIKESLRSVTPAQGTGESPRRVRATWQRELIAHFDQHKRYPGRPSLDSANVLVNFVIDETGRVLSSGIVQGSGDASFDEAALAMIRRSDPVPKPPLLIVQEGLSFTLPVIFRVKHAN